MTRFHFIAGLPRSGVAVLSALLRQNPRFVALQNSPAQQVFTTSLARLSEGGPEAHLLNEAQKTALMRGVVDAVYHDRPFGAVVFDANRDWLDHLDHIVALYPLCRIIICVRNPAAIVNSVVLSSPDQMDDKTLADTASRMTAPKGEIGLEIGKLRTALSSRHAERIFVLDYDRLVDDPEDVMDALYEFLREPEFNHNYHEIGGGGETVTGPVRRSGQPMILPTRMILQLSGRAFWRNLRRTSATLMLGRVR
ncbi:MAG: sulfotransferase [Alphaproteobacteria bacterium]|nr:sulfotransferase [Alphaproteobacteria bacterium]